MIKFAVDYDGPIAVRYPRGEAYTGLKEFRAPICLGKSEVIHEGSRVALLAVGSMVKMAEEVQKQLKERMDMDAALVNARFVKPIDEELLRSFADTYELVVTLEENVKDASLLLPRKKTFRSAWRSLHCRTALFRTEVYHTR